MQPQCIVEGVWTVDASSIGTLVRVPVDESRLFHRHLSTEASEAREAKTLSLQGYYKFIEASKPFSEN